MNVRILSKRIALYYTDASIHRWTHFSLRTVGKWYLPLRKVNLHFVAAAAGPVEDAFRGSLVYTGIVFTIRHTSSSQSSANNRIKTDRFAKGTYIHEQSPNSQHKRVQVADLHPSMLGIG